MTSVTPPSYGGEAEQQQRKPVNLAWLADQHRKQEERRCYVCGQRDAGGCDQVDGMRAECPWY